MGSPRSIVAALVGVLGFAACAAPHLEAPTLAAWSPTVDVREGRPEDGLPYRLHLPRPGPGGRPARLLVWLHPSTASMNREVEALVPALAARGLALLVVTDKDFRGWVLDDVSRLFEGTLPGLAGLPGLEIRHPLLLGFSAGGQMALFLWRQFPGAFGGVVVMGAEPVKLGADEPSRRMDPPPPGQAGATPLLVLEGAREPGARMWRAVEPVFRGAGVAIELRVVTGRGHEWLLDDPGEREAMLGWLSRVIAAPAGPPSL
jgi:pimeloyl-ACP methyl ester carboxylesterase